MGRLLELTLTLMVSESEQYLAATLAPLRQLWGNETT